MNRIDEASPFNFAVDDFLMCSVSKKRGKRAATLADVGRELGVSAKLPTHSPFVHLHANSELRTSVNIESDEARGAYSIARGCLEAMAGQGIRAPSDICICGFDDTLAARMTVSRFATVRQPLRQMREHGVELILKRIDAHFHEGVTPPLNPVVFETQPVLRDSTAAPQS